MDSQWIFTVGDRAKDAQRLLSAMGADGPAFKGHDGQGYSRGMYTGLTRKGNPVPYAEARIENGQSYDTTPQPIKREIEMSTAHDHGRSVEQLPNSETGAVPSNPVPGSDWNGSEEIVRWTDTPVIGVPVGMSEQRVVGFNYGWGWKGPLPQSYFDGIRVVNALRQIAHDANKRHWAGETVVRNLRLAETETERDSATVALARFLLASNDDKELKIRMLVNDLANTIDAVAPSSQGSHFPNRGLDYAMKPLRTIVAKIKAAFGNGA